MNKCVKLVIDLVLLATICIFFSSCKKESPTACYTYKDCLGNTLYTTCNQTESEASAYAASHSTTSCHWSYVRN